MIIQASGGVTSGEGSQGPKGDRGLSARVAEGDVMSGATVQRTLIHPADGVQAGDTLIDGHGDLYTITAVTDTTVTVGAAIPDASLKGPKGDGADLHFDTASSFNGDGSANQPYSVRVANGLQLLGDGIAVNAGEGLEVEPETDGVVKLAHASPESIGGITVGAGLYVPDSDPNATLEVAVGEGLSIDFGNNSALVLSPATETSLGGVKIGSGLTVASDGTLNATGSGGGTVTVKGPLTGTGTADDPISIPPAHDYIGGGGYVWIHPSLSQGLGFVPDVGEGALTLKPATSVRLGGIRIGSSFSSDEDGYLRLAPASKTITGGVKVGSGISVTSDGTISVTGGDPADTLILIAQAQSQSVDGDKAAAAACKAVDETPLTLQQLASNPTVLAKVKANPTAMTVLRMSSDAMSLLGIDDVDVASETSMNRLAADTDKLAAFCRNARLLARMARTPVNTGTINVLKAINKSQSLLQTVWQSVTASGWFTAGTSRSADTVSQLNTYGTASAAANCIILTATGYWSTASGQHTNVFVNATQVSDGTLVNTNRPSTVTKTNIGAVSLPTSTWTETGDGWATMTPYTGLDLGQSIWQYPDEATLTTGGITFTRDGNSVHVTGTSNAGAWPVYSKSVTLTAGKYHLAVSGATNVRVEIKNSTTSILNTGAGKYEGTLSAGTYNLNVFVQPSTTVDETVTPYLVKLS